jgi:hypothetical protein
MTWNPPPEKDRPDGYTCLGYSPPWNGYPSFWTECVWHKESQSWFTVEDWKLMEPNTFAPLPEAAAARIAELEAEVERLKAGVARLQEDNERLRQVQPDVPRSWRHSVRFTTERGAEFDVNVSVDWPKVTVGVDLINADDLKSLQAKQERDRKSALHQFANYLAEREEQERRDAVLDQIAASEEDTP